MPFFPLASIPDIMIEGAISLRQDKRPAPTGKLLTFPPSIGVVASPVRTLSELDQRAYLDVDLVGTLCTISIHASYYIQGQLAWIDKAQPDGDKTLYRNRH